MRVRYEKSYNEISDCVWERVWVRENRFDAMSVWVIGFSMSTVVFGLAVVGTIFDDSAPGSNGQHSDNSS